MAYSSLEQCLLDLERNGHLKRVTEEVDPFLELATIHHRVYEAGGPALLFENVKGSRYRTASNIFGTLDRSKFIFRDTLSHVQQLIRVKQNPIQALKKSSEKSFRRLACHSCTALEKSDSKTCFIQRNKHRRLSR